MFLAYGYLGFSNERAANPQCFNSTAKRNLETLSSKWSLLISDVSQSTRITIIYHQESELRIITTYKNRNTSAIGKFHHALVPATTRRHWRRCQSNGQQCFDFRLNFYIFIQRNIIFVFRKYANQHFSYQFVYIFEITQIMMWDEWIVKVGPALPLLVLQFFYRAFKY